MTRLRTSTRILLLGCGKEKLQTDVPVPAKDLYTGPIFKARRRYAEATPYAWYIASAEYHLMPPNYEVRPYDYTLKGEPQHVKARWALRVVAELLEQFNGSGPLKDVLIELHMGEDYADYLTQIIPAVGMSVHWATRGMSQGTQLKWYKTETQRFNRLSSLTGSASTAGPPSSASSGKGSART